MSKKRGRWLGLYSWLLLVYLFVPKGEEKDWSGYMKYIIIFNTIFTIY